MYLQKYFLGLKNNSLVRSRYFAIFCSEFFCTFFFVLCVTSNLAVFVLSRGNYSVVGAIFGAALSIIFAVHMGFLISGSHCNPAVTFFFWVLQEVTWKELILYSFAQTAGSFFGAAVTFATYYDAINDFDGGVREVGGENDTAIIFATFPKPFLTVRGGILDLTISTAVLALVVHPVIDPRNGIPKWAQPSLIGIGVLVSAFSFALNSGSALNPARDLGPRLFLLCAGYGWKVFSFNNYKWFWIPIVGPMLGGLIGTFLYKSFISPFLSKSDEKKSIESVDGEDVVPQVVIIEKEKFFVNTLY